MLTRKDAHGKSMSQNILKLIQYMQKLTSMSMKSTNIVCVCMHTYIHLGKQASMNFPHFAHLVSAFVLDYISRLFVEQQSSLVR